MEHALAVVGSTEASKGLVREAGELAAGAGAELTPLYVADEDDERRERLQERTSDDSTYSVGRAVEGARSDATDVGREVLSDADVEDEAVGTVGDRAETALAESRRRGCDHLFVAGRTRSPTGKALFGDDVQRIVLDAGGPVAVVTA